MSIPSWIKLCDEHLREAYKVKELSALISIHTNPHSGHTFTYRSQSKHHNCHSYKLTFGEVEEILDEQS